MSGISTESWACGRPGRAAGGSRFGFTMIEILIVMSILALVVATGVPAVFRALKKDPMRQAVSDVVEACSLARAHAILAGASMEMVIVADGGAIRVERARRRGQGDAREAVAGVSPGGGGRPTAVSIPSMRLDDDVAVELVYVNLMNQMDEPEVRVRFFPNGTSDELTMVVRHQEQVRKIELDTVTGLADVEVIR